jgi:hypothetical protein
MENVAHVVESKYTPCWKLECEKGRGYPSRRCDDNTHIKMGSKKTRCEDTERIGSEQGPLSSYYNQDVKFWSSVSHGNLLSERLSASQDGPCSVHLVVFVSFGFA